MTVEELVVLNPETGLYSFPHWVVQPYCRPLPIEEVPTKKPSAKETVAAAAPAERGKLGMMS